MNTCERPTVPSGDCLGPNIQHAFTIYGVGKLTAIPYFDKMQEKTPVQARVKYTQAGAVHARSNGPRKQVRGTRASRLCVDLRVCVAEKTAQQGICNEGKCNDTCAPKAVEAPGERYRACRYHCHLPASTELATREMRPSTMVKNSPIDCTVASSETRFGEVTRVGQTIVRTYAVPLVAPSARRAPVPRGIAEPVILGCSGHTRLQRPYLDSHLQLPHCQHLEPHAWYRRP